VVPVRALPEDEIVGRYSVAYDGQNRVRLVHLSLNDAPDCVRLGRTKILKKSSVGALAKLLPECEKPVPGLGGTLIPCKDISLNHGGAWGGVTIRLQAKELPPPYLPPAKLQRVIDRFYPEARVQ
jgi:hypothetical protein